MTEEDKLLILIINFNIKTDRYIIKTNIKKERIEDIVSDYLQIQVGKCVDNRKTKELDNYEIKIELDLSFDSFKVIDNCGNLGLRDGILMFLLQSLKTLNKNVDIGEI